MGAWSGEPFGNDTAADWAGELEDAEGWDVVIDALTEVLEEEPANVDADVACIAIAAAEVVAHHAGRPTQSDAYTESVTTFVKRAPIPPARIAVVALAALEIASSPEGELAELWAEAEDGEWSAANATLREALTPA